MAGLFGAWQPVYAEAGIATFPVREKRPAVNGYLKVGSRVSAQLALKFSDLDAFGFACKPNRITVVDVDTPDERVLADALAEHGPTPVIVRSGSGNWQAWYRNSGEIRKVRPDPSKPIDILGDGFVVAPPSFGSKGRQYQFIQGGLADLASLPRRVRPYNDPLYNRLTPLPSPPLSPLVNTEGAKTGERNNTLWRACMQKARSCKSINELMDCAMGLNAALGEALPDGELLRLVSSAWRYQEQGRNWVGSTGQARISREEILAYRGSVHGLRLWLLLRESHSVRDGPFAISQIEVAGLLGIHQSQMPRLIRELIEMGHLFLVHRGKGKGDPSQYQLVHAATF